MAVVCGSCGAGNREGEHFCANCGEFLDWDGAAAPEPAPVPAPEPRAPSGPPPAPAPTPAATAAPGPVARPIRPPVAPLRPPTEQRARAGPRPGPASAPPPAPAPPAPAPADPAARATTRLLPVPPAPATSSCPNCGTDNDPTRRFCGRCGEWLVTPVVTPPPPPAGFRQTWRRRWFGERGPYTGRLSRATVGFRILAGLVVLAVLTAVLALAGLHPIQRIQDEVGHIRGTGKVTGLTAFSQPAGMAAPADAPPAGAEADPTAAWAVDNVRARGWSTQWTSPTAGDPGAACPSPLGAAAVATTSTSLRIRFPAAIDVREIGFEAGLVQPAERNSRWQPRTLELRWDGGECQSVSLANTPDLQRFGVSRRADGAAGLTGVTVTVVAGFRPAVPGPARLDIGEVTVWQR
jgi:hypothetical protein